MLVFVMVTRDRAGKLKQVITQEMRVQFWVPAEGPCHPGPEKVKAVKMAASCFISVSDHRVTFPSL